MNGQPMPLDQWLDLKSHVYINKRREQIQARLAAPPAVAVPPPPAKPAPVAPTNSSTVEEKRSFFNNLAEQIYAKQRARE